MTNDLSGYGVNREGPPEQVLGDGHLPHIKRLQNVLDDVVRRGGNRTALVGIQLPRRPAIYVVAAEDDVEGSSRGISDKVAMIGSQTKTVTAACIVRLFRDLQLSLDSACGAYISVPYLNPAITIRQLLNCTSGLGEYEDLLFGPSYRGDTAFSPEELIKLSALRGPHFSPGERFEYSNVTFVALALVVESLTGLPYEKAVRQQILQPLGIDMWFASREPLPKARMIEAYWLSETGGERHCADLDHSAALATGDAACTVATALRFWSSLNEPQNSTGVSLAILSESTVLAPRVVIKPTSLGVEYGLGVEVRRWAGDRVVGHPGTIHGARSGSWADPEKQLTVTVYVTNTAIAAEDARIAAQRFQGHALFSSALHTAYALWDLEQRAD